MPGAPQMDPLPPGDDVPEKMEVEMEMRGVCLDLGCRGAGAGRASTEPREGLTARDLEQGLLANDRQQAGIWGREDGGGMATGYGS